MTFECTNCQLRYKIDDSLIPPDGARVKCRRCSTLIDVPAPVIELAPVDLELIPPPPPKRMPRIDEAPAVMVEAPAERTPAPAPSVAAPAPPPRAADPEPRAADESVTLEQQLAAEARSVPPSPDIEHDSSFVERFDAPSAAAIPADPAFEHIGAAAAQASYEPATPSLETEPLGTPPPAAFESTPAPEPAPVLETSGAPNLGEPSLSESPSLAAPTLAAPTLAAPRSSAVALGSVVRGRTAVHRRARARVDAAGARARASCRRVHPVARPGARARGRAGARHVRNRGGSHGHRQRRSSHAGDADPRRPLARRAHAP